MVEVTAVKNVKAEVPVVRADNLVAVAVNAQPPVKLEGEPD